MKYLTICLLVLFSASRVYAEVAQEEHHAHSGHQHEMGELDVNVTTQERDHHQDRICPVMRGKASPEYTFEYKGEKYYFCCSSCIEEFKKNPEKYISKIKTIDLEAFQFGFSPEEIVVKKGDIVKLNITSRDVTHGVYIKEYNVNVPVKKSEEKMVEFLADKVGEFDVLCSVYCGRGHHDMRARLIVEE